jgi:hypothetical protein
MPGAAECHRTVMARDLTHKSIGPHAGADALVPTVPAQKVSVAPKEKKRPTAPSWASVV